MKLMEPTMSILAKQAVIAIAATFVLGTPWGAPALAAPAQSNTTMQSSATALRSGDLVRLRSGGPLMTIKNVEGDQVNCIWTEEGEIRSGSFPVALLATPLTTPPVDPAIQQDEQEADQYYRTHCPTGAVTMSGKFSCVY
jgi:uncharacterized protein YodC (DUF2158 family)